MPQDMRNIMPHRELHDRPHFELGRRQDEPHSPHRHPPYIFILWVEMRQNIFLFVAILFASLAYRINDQWKQVKKEKLQAELSYLKAQINPHFLFNTLNSIYSLALLKSNKTPEAIVKLSSMMRYVMHEATEKYVSLESELNYIQSYIDLQKIRLDETVSVVYDTEIEVDEKKIAPLILIPFIENAFKHGVNPEVNSSIIITLKTKEDTLTLYVYNLKVPHSEYLETKSGYGLANAKQQLNLLYPDKHSLYLQNEADYFSVSLTLDLRC
jgi:LytS/YehU family sensor histidine kinase